MIGRFLLIAASMAAVSVGVATVVSRSPAPASQSGASLSSGEGNWTMRGHESRAAASAIGRSGGDVRIERSGDSHFYADTSVNGTSVRMMIDSGASLVALTRADAEAIGINVDALPEAGYAETAGGRVPVRPVMLETIAVDGVEVSGVQAAVVDSGMSISLLGQSFLTRLESVNVEGKMMTLR